MSARRQPSTTSLSKYARANSPDLSNSSLDFCNAFWGLGEGGVDVLFARMRGAMRTMEELRNFWKERAGIEEQYAKRLASLAKVTLGRDEIGDLRLSLDTLRQETEKQSGYHLLVAQQIKNDLEGQTSVFLNKQQHHKKAIQAAVEKEHKAKQIQESYVNKAREKYESDCMRINSYTAQSTLMQGKDLDKIMLKLERAQQTVQANEKDFAHFARALQDTVQKWKVTWKAFCDSCQDLEEERVEFTKDNMWAYANAISTVCVADDESCERLRLSLEQLEPDRDMENFVRDYGTGSAIPEPPAFVNYANADAVPSSSQQPRSRPANFNRSSQRARQAAGTPPPPEEAEPTTNIAGVGIGGGRRTDVTSEAQPSRTPSRGRSSSRPPVERVQPNSTPSYSSQTPRGQVSTSSAFDGMRLADPQADPIDPTATTMIKIGDAAYPVDLAHDPQVRSSSNIRPPTNGSVGPVKVGQEDDPLAQQMAELQKAAPTRGVSVRRNSPWVPPSQGQGQVTGASSTPDSRMSPTKRDHAAKLSPPPGGAGDAGRRSSRDYGPSAEMVVGIPPGTASSRSASPNPPYPKHMVPPSTGASGTLPVQDILHDYQQSLPGERKSVSRPTSRAGSIAGLPGPALGQSQSQIQRERPLSISGQAGIGAQGRSTSPQPYAPPSRSHSPAAQQPPASAPSSHRNSYSRVPPPSANGQGHGHAPSQGSIRHDSISVPQPSPHHQRPASPNSVGIAIDHQGRVAMDEMAQRYKQQQQQQQPAYTQPAAPQPTQTQLLVKQQPTYSSPNNYPSQTAPPQNYAPGPYGGPSSAAGTPPYGHSYGMPQSSQSGPVARTQGVYAAPAPVQYPQHTQQPPQVYHPQPTGYGGQAPSSVVQTLQNGASMNNYYPNGLVQPTQNQYRAPSPARVPSPQPPVQSPTGQYTEDGRPVLFYVKALYDYQATIDEEFDFQSGDVIAVTHTPEDGWWSGELLDEARRQPGRHVFPSNFVTLF